MPCEHLAGCLLAIGSSVALAPSTERISISSAGLQADFPAQSVSASAISSNGRHVVFSCASRLLVDGDTNQVEDVFVRDRALGQTTRVSVDSAGVESNDVSYAAAISGDGRYVTFSSFASNLVPDDTNAAIDLFAHDRRTGRTTRASVDSAGNQGNVETSGPHAPTYDGRFVGFSGETSNLVAGDTNAASDVFVRDTLAQLTFRVSVSSAGTQANDHSVFGAISGDGRYVAFQSGATDLVANDTNSTFDVFVHDRATGQTLRVSVDSSGAQGNGASLEPSIAAAGRYVVFSSAASNLVPGDTNASRDVFRHELQTGRTRRVSVASSGAQANDDSGAPSVTADGRHVAFASSASNLSSFSGGQEAVFVRDVKNGVTELQSVDAQGSPAPADRPSISADGRFVSFDSVVALVADDTNQLFDVYVRGRVR